MAHESTPLLGHGRRGTASVPQVFGNVIVSIVGTGVLGLPYTFKVSGWAAGSAAIILAGLLTYYCMMLLVKCRYRLETLGHVSILTYGDLGEHIHGKIGRYVAEAMVLISQCGGCVALMVFIGQTLSSMFPGSSDKYFLYIIILVPVEIALACVRSLSSLAPFSVFADICNVLAMAIVIRDDFHSFERLKEVQSFTNWKSLPFVGGIAIFCFEGFGMTLSLEASMRKPQKFGRVLGLALLFLAAVYAVFGFMGYRAYGNETRDIITLNLPNDWSTVAVKAGLCMALSLTFPVMMHPVHEMFEMKLMESNWFQKILFSLPQMEMLLFNTFRGVSVVILAVLASSVPGFGVLVSIVGSTVCSMLALVFPASFHLKAFKGCLNFTQRAFDMFVLLFGIAFAVYGTYGAYVDIFATPSEVPHGPV